MCGIAGIVCLSKSLPPHQLTKLVRNMANRIAHRGPDDFGEWVSSNGKVAFSHRRLSIIDTSSAGKQPMVASDGRSAITFNGEIYNYLDLRSEFESSGKALRTHTDTEVLLELLQERGTSVIEKLDGMFAFAFYDAAKGNVFLARDSFGEKPLYYLHTRDFFAFASELGALSTLPWFDSTIDGEAVAEYFAFQYVPAPRTIYQKVKKLPPGSYLKLSERGDVEIRSHFTFAPARDPRADRSMDALADELGDILVRSTKRRLMSDVPLGAFLSGGVDSSVTVAIMTRELKQNVKTFSMGCLNSPESEHDDARQMAEWLGTDHNELLIEPDIATLVSKIAGVLDEPLADSSCLPTYLLSEFARRKVTVLLSGDGGDEMFGGYGRYFSTLDEDSSRLKGDQNYAHWKPSDGYFGSRIMIFNEGELAAFLGEIPPETKAGFESYKARLNDPSAPLLSRLRAIDTANYLPGAVLAKVDRMSMQHALEVRTPFLSREVASFAEKLAVQHMYADGQGKLVLKEYASRFIPRPWLERRKRGFGVPTHLWDRSSCIRTLKKLLLGNGALSQYWIGREGLERFIKRNEDPNSFSAYQVWSVLVFEVWLRTHLVSHHERSLAFCHIRDIFNSARSGVKNFVARPRKIAVHGDICT